MISASLQYKKRITIYLKILCFKTLIRNHQVNQCKHLVFLHSVYLQIQKYLSVKRKTELIFQTSFSLHTIVNQTEVLNS